MDSIFASLFKFLVDVMELKLNFKFVFDLLFKIIFAPQIFNSTTDEKNHNERDNHKPQTEFFVRTIKTNKPSVRQKTSASRAFKGNKYHSKRYKFEEFNHATS